MLLSSNLLAVPLGPLRIYLVDNQCSYVYRYGHRGRTRTGLLPPIVATNSVFSSNSGTDHEPGPQFFRGRPGTSAAFLAHISSPAGCAKVGGAKRGT